MQPRPSVGKDRDAPLVRLARGQALHVLDLQGECHGLPYLKTTGDHVLALLHAGQGHGARLAPQQGREPDRTAGQRAIARHAKANARALGQRQLGLGELLCARLQAGIVREVGLHLDQTDLGGVANADRSAQTAGATVGHPHGGGCPQVGEGLQVRAVRPAEHHGAAAFSAALGHEKELLHRAARYVRVHLALRAVEHVAFGERGAQAQSAVGRVVAVRVQKPGKYRGKDPRQQERPQSPQDRGQSEPGPAHERSAPHHGPDRSRA